MKKILTLLLILSFVISLMGFVGCGPKYASQETLDELEEAKSACESAKAEVKNLETQIEDLKNEIAAKEVRVTELEKQLEELKGGE